MTVATGVHDVVMPRLSDTMTEGVISRWLKAAGDAVVKGEPIAEIETDKVTVELVSPADGVLLAQFVSDGGAIAPGNAVAVVGPAGAAFDVPTAEESAAPAAQPEPPQRPIARATPPSPERVKATPLARKLATQQGVDLHALVGSGPDGRILRQDVERLVDGTAAVSSPAPNDVVQRLSPLQRTIADRMAQAKRDVPHYYVDMTVDVTRLREARAELAATGSGDASVNAYIVRAAALALRSHPRVNASWADDTVVVRGAVNVGIAVAVNDDGLVVPVVRDADRKSIAEIGEEIGALVARARAGTLRLEDMRDGTFTISNLGGYGVETFHAVVNPPESAILAVGAIRRVPVFHDEALVGRDVMAVSLSADHRVFSGAAAAAFLADVRHRLEHPLGLLV